MREREKEKKQRALCCFLLFFRLTSHRCAENKKLFFCNPEKDRKTRCIRESSQGAASVASVAEEPSG